MPIATREAQIVWAMFTRAVAGHVFANVAQACEEFGSAGRSLLR